MDRLAVRSVHRSTQPTASDSSIRSRSLVLALLALCACRSGSTEPAVAAPPPADSGAIFPAELADQARFVDGREVRGAFTPSAEQVARLEAALAAALEAGIADPATLDEDAYRHPGYDDWLRGELRQILPRLADYRRQYFGLVDADDRRVILVNAFAGPAFEGGFEFPEWRTQVVCVNDGGFWYWQVEYDVETGDFRRFRSNGYA